MSSTFIREDNLRKARVRRRVRPGRMERIREHVTELATALLKTIAWCHRIYSERPHEAPLSPSRSSKERKGEGLGAPPKRPLRPLGSSGCSNSSSETQL